MDRRPKSLLALLEQGEWLQPPLVPVDHRDVARLLLTGEWCTVVGRKNGHESSTWTVLLQDGRWWYCRLASTRASSQNLTLELPTLARLLHQLARNEMPVVSLVAAVTHHGRTLLVHENPGGHSLSTTLADDSQDPTAREAELRTAALTLARLHRLEPADFSMLPAVPKGFSFINTQLQVGAELLQQLDTESADYQVSLWLARWLEHEKLPCPEVAVLHGGFLPGNVQFSDAGQLRAVLAWEHARKGDPTFDVTWAWLDLQLNFGSVPASIFVEAYQENVPLDPDRLEYFRVFALARRYAVNLGGKTDASETEKRELAQLLRHTAFWRD